LDLSFATVFVGHLSGFLSRKGALARQRADWTDNVVAVQYNQWGHAYRWTDGVQENNRPRVTIKLPKTGLLRPLPA